MHSFLNKDYNKATLTFDLLERKVSVEEEGVQTTWLVCCKSINEGCYKCLELNTTDYNYSNINLKKTKKERLFVFPGVETLEDYLGN